MTRWVGWAPPAAFVFGGLLLVGVQQQTVPELRAPLATALPAAVRGMAPTDLEISDMEAEVAGFTDYALRVYGDFSESPDAVDPDAAGGDSADARWASVYLGFYEQQTRGRTIHSPRNCLPGSGWEAISNRPQTLDTPSGSVTVNRYVLQNGDAQALVLYWYQGRGRVAHDEYLVKWDLLRDAALMRRTDEALVRIVVPIAGSEDEAFEIAAEIARDLVGHVESALQAA